MMSFHYVIIDLHVHFLVSSRGIEKGVDSLSYLQNDSYLCKQQLRVINIRDWERESS